MRRKKGEKTQKDLKDYNICKISEIIQEMLQRSDIIDEEFGKSITAERFITAAVIYGVPTFSTLQTVLEYIKTKFSSLKHDFPLYQTINQEKSIDLDRLANLWLKGSVTRTEDPTLNQWNLALIFS